MQTKKVLRRFLTTKRNAARYNERVVPVGNKDLGAEFSSSSSRSRSGSRNNNDNGEGPQTVFVGNEIKTSKYTWYSFLFR